VKHLSPAYFAMVMATGVVSIAAWDFRLPVLAMGLFAFNLVAYVVVAALTALRAIRYPQLAFADMTDHRLGPASSPRSRRPASSGRSF
jgi:tellurite resistance protein TehA-like permease